jgi:hypothetical protein
MSEIAKLEALEILDSRGNPTLAVTATLADGSLHNRSCRKGISDWLNIGAGRSGSASRINIVGSNQHLPRLGIQAKMEELARDRTDYA